MCVRGQVSRPRLRLRVIRGRVSTRSLLYDSLCRWDDNQSRGQKSIRGKAGVNNNTCYNNTGDVNGPVWLTANPAPPGQNVQTCDPEAHILPQVISVLVWM